MKVFFLSSGLDHAEYYFTFCLFFDKFPLATMGSSLLGLRTFDPTLGAPAPSPPAELFW